MVYQKRLRLEGFNAAYFPSPVSSSEGLGENSGVINYFHERALGDRSGRGP